VVVARGTLQVIQCSATVKVRSHATDTVRCVPVPCGNATRNASVGVNTPGLINVLGLSGYKRRRTVPQGNAPGLKVLLGL